MNLLMAAVGRTVYWYAGADTKNAPLPAMVIQANQHGLGLQVHRPRAHDLRWISGCRHISSPIHQSAPEIAQESGGWDFCPWDEPTYYVPPVPPETLAQQQAKAAQHAGFLAEAAAPWPATDPLVAAYKPPPATTDEPADPEWTVPHEAQVLELMQKHGSAQYVAKKLGEPWKMRHVTAIVRKYNFVRQTESV